MFKMAICDDNAVNLKIYQIRPFVNRKFVMISMIVSHGEKIIN